MRPLLVLLAASVLALTGCPAEPTPPRACNGHEALCARPFNELTLLGAHNAMSALHSGFSAPNQRLSLVEQLDSGVHAFLLDTYETDGVMQLCHGTCAFGSTNLDEALGHFADFLAAHPDDVFAFLVEDHAPAEAFAAAMERAGLTDLAITHDAAAPWPTLDALIDADTRLFVTTENSGPPPAWYQPMFEQYSDTPFSFASVDELAADASCDVNRGAADNALFLVNHWLGNPLPSEELSVQANVGVVLRERVDRCAAARGRQPNVLAVDWVDVGDAAIVVDELNGVTP